MFLQVQDRFGVFYFGEAEGKTSMCPCLWLCGEEHTRKVYVGAYCTSGKRRAVETQTRRGWATEVMFRVKYKVSMELSPDHPLHPDLQAGDAISEGWICPSQWFEPKSQVSKMMSIRSPLLTVPPGVTPGLWAPPVCDSDYTLSHSPPLSLLALLSPSLCWLMISGSPHNDSSLHPHPCPGQQGGGCRARAGSRAPATQGVRRQGLLSRAHTPSRALELHIVDTHEQLFLPQK